MEHVQIWMKVSLFLDFFIIFFYCKMQERMEH